MRKSKWFLVIAACLFTVLLSARVFGGDSDLTGSAQTDGEQEASSAQEEPPCGFEGILDGILSTKALETKQYAVGSTCEKVLVGQRLMPVKTTSGLDVGEEMANTVETLTNETYEMSTQTAMSDEDYENLLAIVEAEAGGEDIEGRILVANVVLNRVADPDYPDTVTEVIFQKVGGSAQFTPTVDGSIYQTPVDDTTREAVNRAIDGEDLSQGALHFISKYRIGSKVYYWFEENLTFVLEHNGHRFYK